MSRKIRNKQQTIDIISEFKIVPRGTIEKLEAYVALLLKWNKKINLIGKGTEEEIWERHILDSAQLLKFIPEEKKSLLDVGSGAGLPGMILAILGFPKITLVESDNRKCAFLEEAKRITSSDMVTIHNQRIEQGNLGGFDVITCRAFAPLSDILLKTAKMQSPKCLNLYLKGSNVHTELEEANKKFEFDVKLHPSITDSKGYVVAIGNMRAKRI